MSAQLAAVQQRAAAIEAALHAELATLRYHFAKQGSQCPETLSTAGDVTAESLRDQVQLGVPATIPGKCCEDDAAQAFSDDSADTDCEPISALLEARDGSAGCNLLLHDATTSLAEHFTTEHTQQSGDDI